MSVDAGCKDTYTYGGNTQMATMLRPPPYTIYTQSQLGKYECVMETVENAISDFDFALKGLIAGFL